MAMAVHEIVSAIQAEESIYNTGHSPARVCEAYLNPRIGCDPSDCYR